MNVGGRLYMSVVSVACYLVSWLAARHDTIRYDTIRCDKIDTFISSTCQVYSPAYLLIYLDLVVECTAVFLVPLFCLESRVMVEDFFVGLWICTIVYLVFSCCSCFLLFSAEEHLGSILCCTLLCTLKHYA